MPSAILFDLDGTLVDRPSALLAWSLCRLANHESSDAQRTQILRIARSSSTRTIFLRRVNPLLPEPASRDELDATFHTFITPNEALLTALHRIAQRIPIAILSNGDGALQRLKLRASKLESIFAQRIFISSETTFLKPDARAFEHARNALGASAQETLMVGNHPRIDIRPAKQLGYQTALVQGPEDVLKLLALHEK